jgi:hypothetical protein
MPGVMRLSSKIWPTRPLWVESGPKPLLSGEGGKQTLGHQRLCRVSGAQGDRRDQRQRRGRDQEGQFTKPDVVWRSPSQDLRQSARRPVEPGHGHKGDQKRKK